MEKADNRGVAEGEDGYLNGTTGLPVGIHLAYHNFIGVVRKTFRLRTGFPLQTLMQPSYFRNIIVTSGINT